MKKLSKTFCSTYEDLLPSGAGESFFENLDKLDDGLTKRLARRPIQNMEISTVVKQAERQFRQICLKEKKDAKPPRKAAPKSQL